MGRQVVRQHDRDDDLLDKEIYRNMTRASCKHERAHYARKLGEHLAKRTIERIEAALDAAGLTGRSRRTSISRLVANCDRPEW